MRKAVIFLGGAVAALLAIEAQAIEQAIEPIEPTPSEAEAAREAAPVASLFDVGFGASVTTDYVSRGITQTGSDAAIQGYIEPSIGMAYINVWSSNVNFGEGFSGAEIDTAIGIRPEFGPLSLDLGYVHYFYAPEEVSPDYGELFAKADYNFRDMVTFGARVFFAPDFNQSGKTATFVAGGLKVPLPHDFSVYAGIGYQFFEDPDAFEQLAWTAGVSYDWKALTFDVRYWDTDLDDDECVARSGFADGCDARIVGTISFNTAWSDFTKGR
ncbi:MAG: TorF family putative porin [Mesorhizobium sp.]|jgi:uncharacterized protein (TIGR02001 family)